MRKILEQGSIPARFDHRQSTHIKYELLGESDRGVEPRRELALLIEVPPELQGEEVYELRLDPRDLVQLTRGA
jgi:hypothetical protein